MVARQPLAGQVRRQVGNPTMVAFGASFIFLVSCLVVLEHLVDVVDQVPEDD